MRTKQLAPRSFRLQDPAWERLKIVALEQGFVSRHAYLTAHLTAIANASIEKAPNTV
jgi:hypothetical protein